MHVGLLEIRFLLGDLMLKTVVVVTALVNSLCMYTFICIFYTMVNKDSH